MGLLERRLRQGLARAAAVATLLAVGAACASSAPGIAVPSVPLPPPRFTSSTILPKDLVVGEGVETLGDAFDRIKTALERGAITEWSIYAFADDGFAVVTRLETIQDTGEPALTRWSARRPAYRERGFEVESFRERLFNEPPGRYRVMVLAVTGRPFASAHQKPQLLKELEMEDLAAGRLPDELRDRLMPDDARCEVLVYELFRPRDLREPATLLEGSEIDARAHLLGAGMWASGELGR